MSYSNVIAAIHADLAAHTSLKPVPDGRDANIGDAPLSNADGFYTITMLTPPQIWPSGGIAQPNAYLVGLQIQISNLRSNSSTELHVKAATRMEQVTEALIYRYNPAYCVTEYDNPILEESAENRRVNVLKWNFGVRYSTT